MAASLDMRSGRSPFGRFLYVGGNSETSSSQTFLSVTAAQPACPTLAHAVRDTTTWLSVECAMPAGVFRVYDCLAHCRPSAASVVVASTVPSFFCRLTCATPVNPAFALAHKDPE